jgi:hypothetical protein
VNEEQARKYEDLPKADSVRLVDFGSAEVLTLESLPPQFLLVVTGTKPFLNMEVELVPLVFVRRPEYWGVEVVGRLPGGIGLPALTPYTVSTNLSGITGTEGIEVIGATRSEKIRVPPEEEAGNCRDWNAWHDHQPPGPPTLHVRGECEFPTAGHTVELKRQEPQGINPKDLLLAKVVHEPTGPVAQIVTTVEARYQEETDFEYDTVTILPDGVSVPVEEVH